jgi:four helix bundle protein
MEYTLETLEVYKLAEEFSDKVWFIVSGWDYHLKKGLGIQLTNAADSVSANIAEGYGRHYFGESRNFYFYARGSLLESKSWLGKCKRRKIISETQCDELLAEVEIIMAKLVNYIKFVQKSQRNLSNKKALT